MKGPDIHFLVHDIHKNGEKVIITADFFDKRLRLIWKEKDPFVSKTLDDGIGHAFDIQMADINGDSKMELLVLSITKIPMVLYLPMRFQKTLRRINGYGILYWLG